jgi:hypothetical protein
MAAIAQPPVSRAARPAPDLIQSVDLVAVVVLSREQRTCGHDSLASTAQASSLTLPGDPLYVVKQAGEALALARANGDEARAEVLIGQAGVRLDETARLGQLGRTTEALTAAHRYETTIDQATAALESANRQNGVGSPMSADSKRTRVALETQLGRAVDLITRAPDPASSLRRCLMALPADWRSCRD